MQVSDNIFEDTVVPVELLLYIAPIFFALLLLLWFSCHFLFPDCDCGENDAPGGKMPYKGNRRIVYGSIFFALFVLYCAYLICGAGSHAFLGF